LPPFLSFCCETSDDPIDIALQRSNGSASVIDIQDTYHEPKRSRWQPFVDRMNGIVTTNNFKLFDCARNESRCCLRVPPVKRMIFWNAHWTGCRSGIATRNDRIPFAFLLQHAGGENADISDAYPPRSIRIR